MVTCDACNVPVTVKTPNTDDAAAALAQHGWKARRIKHDGRVRFVNYCPTCPVPAELNRRPED